MLDPYPMVHRAFVTPCETHCRNIHTRLQYRNSDYYVYERYQLLSSVYEQKGWVLRAISLGE